MQRRRLMRLLYAIAEKGGDAKGGVEEAEGDEDGLEGGRCGGGHDGRH